VDEMIQATKETISYSWLIFVETWRAVERQTGILKLILSLGVVLGMLSCLIFISLITGFPPWIELIINDISSEIRIDATKLAFVIFVVALISPFLFLRQAAKIYREQDEKIKIYEPDMTKIIVKPDRAAFEQRVGIKIENLILEDFDGVIELIEMSHMVLTQGGDQSWDEIIEKDNCHFQPCHIAHNDFAFINIAEFRDRALIIFTEKMQPAIFDIGIFTKDYPPPRFFKSLSFLDFEIRGKFSNNEKFIRRYTTTLTVRDALREMLPRPEGDYYVLEMSEIELTPSLPKKEVQ